MSSDMVWLVVIISALVSIFAWVCVINSFRNHSKRLRSMERFLNYIWDELTEEQKDKATKSIADIRKKELNRDIVNFQARSNKFEPEAEEVKKEGKKLW